MATADRHRASIFDSVDCGLRQGIDSGPGRALPGVPGAPSKAPGLDSPAPSWRMPLVCRRSNSGPAARGLRARDRRNFDTDSVHLQPRRDDTPRGSLQPTCRQVTPRRLRIDRAGPVNAWVLHPREWWRRRRLTDWLARATRSRPTSWRLSGLQDAAIRRSLGRFTSERMSTPGVLLTRVARPARHFGLRAAPSTAHMTFAALSALAMAVSSLTPRLQIQDFTLEDEPRLSVTRAYDMHCSTPVESIVQRCAPSRSEGRLAVMPPRARH